MFGRVGNNVNVGAPLTRIFPRLSCSEQHKTANQKTMQPEAVATSTRGDEGTLTADVPRADKDAQHGHGKVAYEESQDRPSSPHHGCGTGDENTILGGAHVSDECTATPQITQVRREDECKEITGNDDGLSIRNGNGNNISCPEPQNTVTSVQIPSTSSHLSERVSKAANTLRKVDRLSQVLLEWQQCTILLSTERDRLRDELAVDQKSREKLVQVSKDQRGQIQALEKALQEAQDAAQSTPKLQLEVLNLEIELTESRQVLAQEKDALIKQGREAMREDYEKQTSKMQSEIDVKESKINQLQTKLDKLMEKFDAYKTKSESEYTKLQLAHDKQTQLLSSNSVAGSQINMANIYRKKIQEQKIEIRRLQQGSRK